MNQNFQHKSHGLTKTKNLPADRDERTKQMLREIAFVLKLTEKVRHQIETDEEVAEFAMA